MFEADSQRVRGSLKVDFVRSNSSQSALAPRQVNAAWWSVVILFLVHGLVVASWVARIPAVQTKIHVNNGILGLTLLSSAVGALCSIPVTGWLIGRYGSKHASLWTSVFFCFSVVGMGFAVNAFTLAIALYIYGAAAAAMDVSMNAQGVEVEKRLGQPTMSRFHGMFSLGAMAGAAIGGAIAARQVTLWIHFLGAALICVCFVLLVAPRMLDTDRNTSVKGEHRLPLSKLPRVLLVLSAISFCMLLSEGAMADWTAIYLRQSLLAGPGIAAAGYAVFSAAMAIFRFAGDMITARIGAFRTVLAGSLVGAGGLILALCANTPLWAMPGFGAAGAGFSVIVPLVFGSGGKIKSVNPGAGIATVTGLGYIGFIVGPPLIGFASQAFTLRYALGIVVGCCLLSAILSPSIAELNAQPVESSPSLEF